MIVIVIGLPGTGKTTFSKALASKIKGLHLNTDIIRDHLDLRGQYDRKTKRLIYDSMLKEARKAIEADRNVIVDGTFYNRRIRDNYQRLANDFKVPLYWIQLRADPQSIKSRVKKKRKYSEADFEVYLKVKAIFEPIMRDCLKLWTDQEDKLEDLVQKAVNHFGMTA